MLYIRRSSASVLVRYFPSGDVVMISLKYGSCETTTLLSFEITTSISRVVTPRSIAFIIEGIVFSGIKPLAPRCPCRSRDVLFFILLFIGDLQEQITKTKTGKIQLKNFISVSL